MASTLSSAIGWADLKVAFGLFLRCDSQVMLKENLLISVAHDECGLSGITVERDMIGGEAMPKAMVRFASRPVLSSRCSSELRRALGAGRAPAGNEGLSPLRSFWSLR